ncbi:hypothetical protein [Faecalispora anaeroviscerum]|uniref:hypothetical protein n=1 Tax=Faecalispora anaeroviscerum TaxID=2991836 RepID=UPI0024BAD5EA|nr:hypothetical protein [Faecalispora anaeroviscerum]
MTRAAFLRRMLEQYGTEVVVTVQGEAPVTVRAMIQAMNYKSKGYPDDAWMPEGYFDNSHFFYIGPPNCRLDQMRGAALCCAGREYGVIRAQGFAAGNRILYVWAVLRELPGEATNDKI